MTTNVRDSIEQVFAADSRWSINLQDHGLPWILFADDAPYQKIIMAAGAAFMFAGDSRAIDLWKSAAKVANEYPDAIEWSQIPLDGIAVSVANIGTCEVVFEYGHAINGTIASFAGSGAQLAMKCWAVNRQAERAVKTASASDRFTGGEARYCRLTTGNTNFGPDKALSDLNTHILDEGLAMNIRPTGDNVMSIRQAARQDDRLAAVLPQVHSGKISAIAPHEGMHKKATHAEQQSMAKSMNQLFKRQR
jgi:hypothetical protein